MCTCDTTERPTQGQKGCLLVCEGLRQDPIERGVSEQRTRESRGTEKCGHQKCHVQNPQGRMVLAEWENIVEGEAGGDTRKVGGQVTRDL